MDSHIQIPKCVLRKFTNEKQIFHKYEINTKRISKGNPKKTGTEENYYSESMEKVLNLNLENKLPILLNFAEEIKNTKNYININDEIQDIGMLYFKSLIFRNLNFHNQVKEKSVFAQFINKTYINDFCVNYGMNENLDNYFVGTKFDKKVSLENLDITFLNNYTKIPFVLPYCGMYSCDFNKKYAIFIPLNSFCCMMLLQKGEACNQIFYVEEDNIKLIEKMNKIAVNKQINEGNGYIICCDKNYLKHKLKEMNVDINENKKVGE